MNSCVVPKWDHDLFVVAHTVGNNLNSTKPAIIFFLLDSKQNMSKPVYRNQWNEYRGLARASDSIFVADLDPGANPEIF